MTLVCVARHDRLKGWSSPQHDHYETLKVSELEAAVRATWPNDAHMTMYASADGSPAHRINKAGVALYAKALVVTTFLADYDTPQHKPWCSAEEAAEVLLRWSKIPALATAGFFSSWRGARIIQPLASPLPVHLAEPYYLRWLALLRHHGIEYDEACKGVLRLWRCANVRRSDKQTGRTFDFRSPHIWLDHMTPVELEPLPEPTIDAVAAENDNALPSRSRSRPTVVVPVGPQVDDVGEPWCFRVPVIAKACLEVAEGWHTMFLLLCGALLNKGAPPTRLVALALAISAATEADTRPEDRRQCAETTLDQYKRGAPFAGFRALAREFRGVALALEESLAIRSQEDLERWREKAQAPPLPSADEAAAALGEILETLSAGSHIVIAPPGLGKTHAATQLATKRAQTPYASPDAKGVRAPPHSRTIIYVDKHRIGKELQRMISEQGIDVQRHFGPLSAQDEQGNPLCKYHDIARHVVAGGQPMQYVMCEGQGLRRCDQYDACKAREGFEGPANARILIAPHALMRKLGPSQFAIIDENAAMLETEAFTVEDFRVARAGLSDFVYRYAAALRPAVDVFEDWLSSESEVDAHRSLAEIEATHAGAVALEDIHFAQAQTGMPGTDLAGFARAVASDGNEGKHCEFPPLRDWAVYNLRQKAPAELQRFARASRLLKTLLHVLSTTDTVIVRRGPDVAGQRVALFTFPNQGLAEVLRGSDVSVVLDASAESELAMYERVLGYAPTVHRLEARDACTVERTHIYTTSANRTNWFPGGTLEINDSLVRAVRDGLRWAAERPDTRKLGIITMQHVEIALRAAHNPDDPWPAAEWERLGQPASILDAARKRLGPLFREHQGQIVFAHYGDLRGRNDMQDLDALITLGDPRPNIGQARVDITFGKQDVTPHALADARCAEELNQAHGRLRTVRRTAPCRSLHVGSVRPAGREWQAGVIEQSINGRVAKAGDMDSFELLEHITRLGGVRPAARRVECSPALLSLAMKGARTLTAELASKLRSVA